MSPFKPKKSTLVIGASTKPYRYSYRAIQMLREAGHPVSAYGLRTGEVAGVSIHTQTEALTSQEFDTVTLYVGPKNQGDLLPWLLQLKPRRVIFNPGTENSELAQALRENGIEPVFACTLVMIGTQQY